MFKRWSKAFLKLVAVLAVLFLLFLVFERVRGPDSLTRYQQELIANGEKLTVQNLQSSVSDAENGAPAVYAAIGLLEDGAVLPNWYPPCMRLMPSGRAIVGFREPEWVEDNRTNHWEEAGAEMKKNEAALAAIRAALGKPGFDNKLDYSAGPKMKIQHLSPPKTLLRWFGPATQLALREAQTHTAAQNLVAQIRLPLLLAEDRILIGELVRFTIAAIARSTTWESLQAEGWSDEDLAAIQTAWEEQRFASNMVRSLEGERIFMGVGYEMMRKSNQDAWDALYWQENFFAIDEADRPFWERFTRLLPFGEEIAGFFKKHVYCRLWRFAWSRQGEKRNLQKMQKLIELARQAATEKSFASVRTALDQLENQSSSLSFYDRLRYPDAELFEGLLPGAKRTLRAETDRSLTIAAIALKRHHLRHGEYPETLDALVPEFVAAVPVDYMDGQPLRYRRNADGSFTLYSVGENLTDDGGDAALPPDRKSFRNLWTRKDYVWPAPALPEEIEAYREEQRKN
jgi:hypothetical protein